MSDEPKGHDWVLLLAVPITAKEMRRAMTGQRLVLRKVDPTSCRTAEVGCFACEQPASRAVQGPCPGEPVEPA